MANGDASHAGRPGLVLRALIRDAIGPSLVAAGMRRRRQQNVWCEGSSGAGWSLLDVQSSPWNRASTGQLTVNVSVWPPGCWEHYQRFHASTDTADEPFAASNAPISGRPGTVTGRWGGGDHWWSFDADTNLEQLGSELAAYCVRKALPWARTAVSGNSTISRLVAGDSSGHYNLRYAIAASWTQHRDPAAIRQLVDQLSRAWVQRPLPSDLPEWIDEQDQRLQQLGA